MKSLKVKIDNIKNKINNNIYIGFNVRLLINIFAFIACFILFFVFILKIFSIEPEKKFNYIDKSNVDYKVYLKENDFYEEEYLDKDMIYVANLIDKINVDFNYEFYSDINLDLELKYSIIGKLSIQDSEGKNNYYEKIYNLLNEKTITLNNSNKQRVNQEISIDYDEYNAIANTFKSNYGVDTSSKLTLYLIVNKTSKDEEIILNDIDTMFLEIPLSQRSINVEMDYKELNNTSDLISKTNVLIENIIYIIPAFIFLTLIMFLTIKIVRLLSLVKSRKSKYDKYVKRLLTEYDRLVCETSTAPNTKKMEIIEIKKFHELVDIRDNLSLPIMYYSIGKNHKCWFYITHNNKMYLHVVKAVDLENNNNE